METILSAMPVENERDLVAVRQRTRRIAEVLGLDPVDQGRIATAVSEIVRNAYQYARGGKVEFLLADGFPPAFTVRVRDDGAGIPQLQAVLDGRFTSQTGMGLGISGARRLCDSFDISSEAGRGTSVTLVKRLSGRGARIDPATLTRLRTALMAADAEELSAELEAQDKELLRTMEQLRRRQLEIERLNRELDETNRGVVALYSELDERAGDLSRVADLKSRMLSDISHEVRTPLNAMLNVTRLLLDRTDGELTDEQVRQVTLIRNSARTLLDLVNDLLELARLEAGKTIPRVSEFSPADLFGTLRGMFRPLLTSDAVALVFEDVSAFPPIRTDEGKIGQIMRNLIANALKFTERGEVRVSATLVPGDRIALTVQDTGIGIDPADHDRIFAEFAQIDSAMQRSVIGTGLGLPLSRKLAEFLGGNLVVESELGAGAAFTVTVPTTYSERRQSERAPSELTLRPSEKNHV
jgi:signal transduction histidine kinase